VEDGLIARGVLIDVERFKGGSLPSDYSITRADLAGALAAQSLDIPGAVGSPVDPIAIESLATARPKARSISARTVEPRRASSHRKGGIVGHSVPGRASEPRGAGRVEAMILFDRWREWRRGRALRSGEPERYREARRFGRRLGRAWLSGRDSTIRVLTPGAGDSLVAAAFRHGLVEGDSLRDAGEVAHAVLSGFAEGARETRRDPRRRSAAEPCRESAQRGVCRMARQVLQGAESEYRIGAATAAKIRSWPLDPVGPSARA
jgi:hypothetical protein